MRNARSLFARLVALVSAALLAVLLAACAGEAGPGDRGPLPPDYEPPPIDGFPDHKPPSRV